MPKPGERLEALMKDRGYTQRSLAAAVGISEQSIANYIRGETQPRQTRVRRALCDVLGEDVWDTRDPHAIAKHTHLKDLRFLDATAAQHAERLAELLRLEGHPDEEPPQATLQPGHETWRSMPLSTNDGHRSGNRHA